MYEIKKYLKTWSNTDYQIVKILSCSNKAAYLVPVPSQDKVRVAAGRASAPKWGGDGGRSLISPDGVARAPIWMVGVSASVIFPCTTKSRIRFLLAPAHPGSLGKRAVKRLCACV